MIQVHFECSDQGTEPKFLIASCSHWYGREGNSDEIMHLKTCCFRLPRFVLERKNTWEEILRLPISYIF